MTWFIEHLERRSRAWKITHALGLVVVICTVDCLVTPQISFTVFYMLPLGLATWFVGVRFAVLIAFLSDLACLTDDFVSGRLADSHWMIHGWNATVRLIFFLIIVCLLRALRLLHDRQEDIVHKRTAALTAEVGERKRLEKALLEATDRERQRIGRELHDGPCQQLMATALASSSLQRKLEARTLPEASEAGTISDHVRQTAVECRQLAQGLFPTALETGGLRLALEQLTSRAETGSSIAGRFLCDQEIPTLDRMVTLHLYRIAQEAVSNAVKHAGASSILVALSRADDEIIVLVKDTGVGIPQPLHSNGGMGLRIMTCRAELIGARLEVQRDSDGGTLVSCTLPYCGSPTPATGKGVNS